MAVDGVTGYLPPEDPHTVPYRWVEGQSVHRIANAVVDSPESLILTANQQAQRNCERSDLEEVSDEAAEEALEAILDDEDERVAEIVADYRAGNEDVGGDTGSAEIPDDLDRLAYRNDGQTPDLQDLAQAHDIAANQSADELREQLADVRDGEAGGG